MNYIVTTQTKSKGIAALLVLLFGPIGLFYASFTGGLIMCFFSLLFVFAIFLSAVFDYHIIILFLSICDLICFIWAIRAVVSYNNKLIAGAINYNQQAESFSNYTTIGNEKPISLNDSLKGNINLLYQDLEKLKVLKEEKIISEEVYNNQSNAILSKIEILEYNNSHSSNMLFHHTQSVPLENSKNKNLWKWVLILSTISIVLCVLYVIYNSKTDINLKEKSTIEEEKKDKPEKAQKVSSQEENKQNLEDLNQDIEDKQREMDAKKSELQQQLDKQQIELDERKRELKLETDSNTKYHLGNYYVNANEEHHVFFHDTPNPTTVRKGYFDAQETVEVIKIENGFGYVEFTNPSGQTSKGWLKMSELIGK